MTTIQSLLNPINPNGSKSEIGSLKRLSTSREKVYDDEGSPGKDQHSRKKQKLCKDAAVFIRGPVRGECRYPPHEYQDELLAAQHQQFELYPIGEIADYPRRIPYNSEKKTFQNKTGREYLEVFQYRFKIPGEDTTYSMLWDYNIGLVRTTPLFKCCGYSKTTPAKMLNRNPGLRDICHSITGGALVAQGYWIPYDAAKAIAATFCWSIRYALTPVFGVDFPTLCVHPDSDKFGAMLIDPEITKNCTEQAIFYREMEEKLSSRASSTLPSPLTPNTPTYPKSLKHIRAKALKIASSTSGYSTDESGEENYTFEGPTRENTYRNVWTPANTPRSVMKLETWFPAHRNNPRSTKENDSSTNMAASALSPESSSPEVSPKTRCSDLKRSRETNTYETTSTNLNSKDMLSQIPSDEKAAFLLMSLRLQRMSGQGLQKGGKRSAST